jgi:hypothetical protein
MPVEITSKDEYKVEISYKNDNMELKFNSYLEEYPLLRTIQNAVYNKEDKKLIVPLSEENSLINLLKTNKISFKKSLPSIEPKGRKRVRTHLSGFKKQKSIEYDADDEDAILENVVPRKLEFLDIPDSQNPIFDYEPYLN